MGNEFRKNQFTQQDFERFELLLKEETSILENWFKDKRFSGKNAVGGFELEACLIDEKGLPAPAIEKLIDTAQNPLISQEVAQFCLELNVEPQPLKNRGLSILHERLKNIWHLSTEFSHKLGYECAMIGILPTLRKKDIEMINLSNMNRFYVLNQQILQMRNGVPLSLDIVGKERLNNINLDIMLIATGNSFQVQMQVPFDQAVCAYNASLIMSAPLVAIAANSPYLFKKQLWEETRIPVCEQTMAAGGFQHTSLGSISRWSFNSDYAYDSIFECFYENLDQFPLLVPDVLKEEKEKMPHVRLHNGTIWRWNRPLLGFDEDGVAHIRIEDRVMSVLPTIIDNMANAAFCFGTKQWFIDNEKHASELMPYACARDNFYQAARYGLDAYVIGLDGKKQSMQEWIMRHLLPAAYEGLEKLGANSDEANYYLRIIEARVTSKKTGASWQRNFVAKYGLNMHELLKHYLAMQASGELVHLWN